ncbi:GGDEF family protein [Aliivibrio wodanis]|uniref:diguanylate cyclase n=1 Tax=Aliivibrio wodanis TaxID=80852 RepID=A0A090ISI7_9GAMM|nr:GGDEF family protein [Aliivibrio wodanis]
MTYITKRELTVQEYSWAVQTVDNMDAGVVVVDLENKVCAWNHFMQAYSGVNIDQALGKSLFELFPTAPQSWLTAKINLTRHLSSNGFSNWEERPLVFPFQNFTPVSDGVASMYQNLVFSPMLDKSGDVSHVCIMVHDVSEMAKNQLHLRETSHNLSKLNQFDELTGLYNKSQLINMLGDEFHKNNTSEQVSTLVLLDIDGLSGINENYGRVIGDEFVKLTASTLHKTARRSDFTGRYSNEIFAAILPETSADQAMFFTERLRKRIETKTINCNDIEKNYTISLSVSQFNPAMSSYQQWIATAEKALNDAKNKGKNQTVVFGLK